MSTRPCRICVMSDIRIDIGASWIMSDKGGGLLLM